jgi:hypothetical protein
MDRRAGFSLHAMHQSILCIGAGAGDPSRRWHGRPAIFASSGFPALCLTSLSLPCQPFFSLQCAPLPLRVESRDIGHEK